MNGQSLGMIETWGYVGAVEALDAGMKAANVFFRGCKITPSALVTVSFTGDVSAVKTAVSAGVAAALKVGKVVAHHVIPRPDTQLCPEPPGHDRPAASPPLEAGKTEEDSSGALRPETKNSDAVNGLKPDKSETGKQTIQKKPRRKSKTSPFENKAKRSDGKPTLSQKKTADRMQKKKPSWVNKKSSAYGPRHQPMNET
ncbi:MAG: BMC domain-containing protein, partial [Nanoarchaeota archaeon]|nr:BMC domain-containing protein [Nanoarchaeota archaeon]